MNSAHAADGISIHLSSPVLGTFFGIPITSTLVTTWVVMILLIGGAILLKRGITLVPKKAQSVAELLIGYTYDYIAEILESRVLARRFLPLILTIFIFVLALNWFGLLPGVDAIGIHQDVHGERVLVPFLHPTNTDLNMTLAIAVISFFAIEIAGVLMIGAWKYGGKFFNFKSPLGFLIGIIEFFSELARLISFSFRLFGNIFAGKTLLLITMFFVPFVLPVPILAFELFVGVIQAFIFAVLTLFFVKLAIEEPH